MAGGGSSRLPAAAHNRLAARLLVPLTVALTEQSADVVVLWNDEKKIDPKYLRIVEKRITETCQYRRVDSSELPLGPNELLVFVRR